MRDMSLSLGSTTIYVRLCLMQVEHGVRSSQLVLLQHLEGEVKNV